MTSQAMASFIDARYRIAASMGGTVQASPVLMADAAGNPVDAIDRSNPGVWSAEQVFSDEFGDTTTLKLTYEVRANAADGSMGGTGGDGGAGSGGGGDGSNAGSGKGASSSWSSHIRALPQTGGIFACPLHILFVLMMLLVSAYTMMRLRQEDGADRREERRCETV